MCRTRKGCKMVNIGGKGVTYNEHGERMYRGKPLWRHAFDQYQNARNYTEATRKDVYFDYQLR